MELPLKKPARVTVVAIAATTLALGGAACSGGSDATTAASGPASGELTISAPPEYIDGLQEAATEFEAKAGIKVDVRENVADEERFLSELQPSLEEGKSGGRSILIVSDWMAEQMHELGYLEEIDHGDLPSVFKNLRPKLQHPASDPQRQFSVPWQSDLGGLWVNTVREPHFDSVVDIFIGEGRVTVPTDIRETVPLVQISEEANPQTANTAEWLETIDRLTKAMKAGQIRGFADSEFARYMNNGEVYAAIGPSSDAPLIKNPAVEWLVPYWGCLLSSANMVIPVGAPNTAAALAWMNYLYKPEVAADVSEHSTYVSPVRGAKEVLAKRGSKQAENPLVFPSESATKECVDQASPPSERVEQAWQEAQEKQAGP